MLFRSHVRIVTHESLWRMYLLGGYAYTPEKLCDFFHEQGVTLESPGMSLEAICYLKSQGHHYSVKPCMYQDQHVFLFAVGFIPITTQTRTYRFEEMKEALDMKEELKLEDAPFVTAVY